MRLPPVALATAFASRILVGLHPAVARNSASSLLFFRFFPAIGHHVSKNSTTTEFFAPVQSRFGIISAGEDNLYGHPSPELLERLENAGMRVLRTDRDGAVYVLTDGTRLGITCFIACPATKNAAR